MSEFEQAKGGRFRHSVAVEVVIFERLEDIRK